MMAKAVLFVAVCSVFLYGIGVAILRLLDVDAGYSEGRITLALSFFFSITAAKFLFFRKHSSLKNEKDEPHPPPGGHDM